MNAQLPDYYRLLGVSPQATTEEIRQAYRRLARRFHPDVSREPDATARFHEVSEAWSVLGDARRRQEYDRARGQSRRERARGRADAGPETGRPDEAPAARAGGGRRPGLLGRLLGRWGRHRQDGGAARVARARLALQAAHRGGTQILRVDGRRLRVHIPPGVRPGGRLRLRGQGPEGTDLVVELAVEVEPPFRLEEGRLVLDLPVAPWEALDGARIQVPTLDGPVMLAIPPGSCSGQRLRLRGKGYGPHGDLLVQLMVQVPAEADAEWRAACARLREQGFDPRAGWP
ncbi:MAG: J domain-containing protein [Gammaproteobacteria bacterium]|nr:MAG: J domain-containing protein [Gammaproteobacteria bacterium]